MEDLQVKATLFYNSLCPSAKTYLIVQSLFLVMTIGGIMLLKRNVSVLKELLFIIPYGIWVIIHDSLCKYGWGTLSWVLVIFIILSRPLLLFTKIKVY